MGSYLDLFPNFVVFPQNNTTKNLTFLVEVEIPIEILLNGVSSVKISQTSMRNQISQSDVTCFPQTEGYILTPAEPGDGMHDVPDRNSG